MTDEGLVIINSLETKLERLVGNIDPSYGDLCRGCFRPTNPNHPNYESGRFVNRTPTNDGWYYCGYCGGFECDECGKDIYIDCEVRVKGNDYNLHEICALKLISEDRLDKNDIEYGLDWSEEE